MMSPSSPQSSEARAALLQLEDSADAQDAVAGHHAQSVCFVQAQQLVCSSQVSHTPSLHAPLAAGSVPEQADDEVPSLL
jgi:hypothetical protein